MKNIKIKQTLNKLKFKTMKHSPEIFMGVGVMGALGATVLACKSTLKVTKVLDKSKETINTIHETVEDEKIEYTRDDAKKDLTIVYLSTTLDVVKLYAPSILLGSLSLGCMIHSHNILNRRNVALAAALTTTSESFTRYRKGVIERYGERIDHELKHGIRSEKITVTETDENGKTKNVKKTIDVADNINECSDYARFYNENCSGWTNDPEYNLMFLKAQQQYANDKLIAQGYLFLNDVYDMLGIPRSKAGQIVGWTYDPENPDGDNYIDFGIYDVNVAGYRDEWANDSISEERQEFVNGYRPSILLDFNVDGNIWANM